jgi:hypothetical protein
MENLTPEYLLLALLGMIIHILMKVSDRRNKKDEKLSLKGFFSDSMNWIRMMLSILSAVALIMMSDDISSALGITLTDGSSAKTLFAFTAGYLNHSLIGNLLKIFNKSSKSKLNNE